MSPANRQSKSVAQTSFVLLTPAELLERLRLPVDNVQARTARLRARGLKGVRLGKTLYYDLQEVEKFIASRMAK